LGILIGVFAVVTLIALGTGLKNYIEGQFQGLGVNTIYVLPGRISGGGFSQTIPTTTFDERDAIRLARLNEAEFVVPIQERTFKVSVGKNSEYVETHLTTEAVFPSTPNLKLLFGRFFTKNDVDKRAKVAVIGPKIATKLFGQSAVALGKNMRLQDQVVMIIGVFQERGNTFGGPDQDSFVYVPYQSLPALNPNKEFNTFKISAYTSNQIGKLKDEVKKVLLKRYEEDDFSVLEQKELLQIINSIVGVINSVLIAIGSISLLVGGVGIMNIMYAAVTERIKEIGIRRAIGATQRNILLQFLSEALILSLLGGLAGLLLAFLATLIVQRFFPAAINFTSVVVALVVSSVIGVFFGVFPANKAAKLSPIDAIRYE
jgi:putative ABC transport system permease protein